MATFLLVTIITASMFHNVQCRICTKMTLESKTHTVKYQDTCIESYQAKCGWLSTAMCTFNETKACMKQRNMTVNRYRIVEDCCLGYHKNKDGKCIKEGVDGSVTEEQDFSRSQNNESQQDGGHQGDRGDGAHHHKSVNNRDSDGTFMNISHGAYAGIVCGILFVSCVALLTALHYRKRQKQKAKQALSGGLDQAHMQQLAPLNTVDTATVDA